MRAWPAAGALAALAAAGCPGADDGNATDAPIDRAPRDGACPAPVDAPAWLDAYLQDQVSRLSGASDLTPGVRLADRASVANRDAARAYLQDQLAGLGLTVSLDDDGAGGANVVGELAATGGTTPSWIIVGAHFDTVSGSPGANDNATGTAVVMAAARALVDLPCRDLGVKFVLFDQEEVGLVGSTTFATRLFQNQVPVTAVHTVDQAGWDADGDRRYEIELPATGMFAEYQDGAAAVGAQVVETTTGGTDHVAFRERGFRSAGVTEEFTGGDTTPFYHRPGDTFATVNHPFHLLAARLVTFVVARELGAD